MWYNVPSAGCRYVLAAGHSTHLLLTHKVNFVYVFVYVYVYVYMDVCVSNPWAL